MGGINVDTTKELPTVIAFCAGYGGIERGLDLAGIEHRVIAYVEIEAYCVANLIAKMEAGELAPAPVYTDLKTFPAEVFRDRVDIITGGYPCQPFSQAGNRKGGDDPRHLWPYIRRHIQSIRPIRVFFENVEGHISLGLSTVLSDLEEDGFRSTFGIFSAAEIGAPHQRKRVWIMGDSQYYGSSATALGRGLDATSIDYAKGQDSPGEPTGASQSESGGDISSQLANSDSVRCERGNIPDRAGQRTVEIEAFERSQQPLVWSEAEGCGGGGGSQVANPCCEGLQGNKRIQQDNGKDSGWQESEHGATSQRSDGAGSKVEMANANSEGLQGSERVRETDAEGQPIGYPAKCSEELADSRCSSGGEGEQQTELWSGGSGESSRCSRDYSTERSYAEGQTWPAGAGPEQYEWEEPRTIWKAESKLGGAVDGSTHRVDRLRLLGNGVVPQTAAKAYITLSERLK
jgi:DNA (cytosine-5)-methyltransferase 1